MDLENMDMENFELYFNDLMETIEKNSNRLLDMEYNIESGLLLGGLACLGCSNNEVITESILKMYRKLAEEILRATPEELMNVNREDANAIVGLIVEIVDKARVLKDKTGFLSPLDLYSYMAGFILHPKHEDTCAAAAMIMYKFITTIEESEEANHTIQ